MTKRISCTKEDLARVEKHPEQARFFCQELEAGHILFFPEMPFAFPKEDQAFLIGQKQTENAGRKNIAYKPHKDSITNLVTTNPDDRDVFLTIMRRYSYGVEEFLGKFLSPYQASWKLDYASFRPMQEKGRNLRKRARNDLLHIDAFPSRSVYGARILRFFTNIHPEKPRKWITADTFSQLLEKFSNEEIFKALKKRPSTKALFSRTMTKCASFLGLPLSPRSTYDDFMLQLHHFLKEKDDYQKNCPKSYWEFPPQSCWLAFTDQLTHAVLEGQFALEQTLLVSRDGLLKPKNAPISLLEHFSKKTLVSRSARLFQ
ncbi:MAG: Kdo hydroxylase family protein [Chlamydiota bacterium]